jgi:hypothetical protein
MVPGRLGWRPGCFTKSSNLSHTTIKHRSRGSFKRGEGDSDLFTVDLQPGLARDALHLRTRRQPPQCFFHAAATVGTLDC